MKKTEFEALNQCSFAERVAIMAFNRVGVLALQGKEKALEGFRDIEHLDERLTKVFGELRLQDVEILRTRFGGKVVRSQKLSGERLGCSASRVREREQKAYNMIRYRTRAAYLRGEVEWLSEPVQQHGEERPLQFISSLHGLGPRAFSVLWQRGIRTRGDFEKLCAGGREATRQKLLNMRCCGPATTEDILRTLTEYNLI